MTKHPEKWKKNQKGLLQGNYSLMKPIVNPNAVAFGHPLRANDAHWGGDSYKQHRSRITEVPLEEALKRLRKTFKNCYEVDPETDCHVWTHTTYAGKLALTGNSPRFGPAKLLPPPYTTTSAKRFIYMATHQAKAQYIGNARIRNYRTCHRYCVNPKHLYIGAETKI